MSEPAASKNRAPRRKPRARDVPPGWELVAEYGLDGRSYVIIRAKGHASALTPRQRQVLARAALGQTNKVIAFELGVSDSTVRVLMARACARLGVKTREEAIEAYRATVNET